MIISVVIRTLNEETYLSELLEKILKQSIENEDEVEIVIVDSGSSDRTLEIANKFNCRITNIKKEDFTFGRSLNQGSEFSNGDILVFISGHCVPVNENWIKNLISPIKYSNSKYVYGRQEGRDTTKFSESKIFEKYFPQQTSLNQEGFFCNNANSALSRKIWEKYKFNEELTGLEDLELAKRIYNDKLQISYMADASVYHIHDETWTQTKHRYERESLALQSIMPEIQINFLDLLRYIFTSILSDGVAAFLEKKFFKEISSIIRFRIAQYLGTYKGNHYQRVLSKKKKENFFYPTKKIKDSLK